MNDISLKDLLEAGCHFGHKVERWHPKAVKYIFQSRDGLHIIDLVKTRDGLKSAALYLKQLGMEGRVILFVATKRQAKGVVGEAAKTAGVPYLTNRWIGGFITNWSEVEKNINKLNTMRKELAEGAWKKFPKHEQVALEKLLHKIETVYTGVSELSKLPDAVFIIDVKKEIACFRECLKAGIPIVAICDTNADPDKIDYPIPANDDAVGSIKFITDYLASAYSEGAKIAQKIAEKEAKKAEKTQNQEIEKTQKPEVISPKEEVKKEAEKAPESVKVTKEEEKKVANVPKVEKVPEVPKVPKKKVTKKKEKAKKS